MAKRDYYKVLDVPRTATEAEIKKAYRRLAMKYHPDRNPDDRDAEESFKKAKEACEVLTDPHKRAAYDQHGHAGVEASGRAGGARGGFSADAFGDIFGDVFGDIFGGARRSGRSQAFRGADLRYELELELPQAVLGHQAEIEVARLAECEVGHGRGAAKGGHPATCDTCGGAGQVRISQGFFQLQQTCPRCRGTGTIVRNPCDSCLGQGRVRRTRKLSVKVPAGVDNGDRVRLAGEGEAGRNGGPPGDLYVEVHVREHPLFERDGEHLSCEVPVSFATAALGGSVAVPTLEGDVQLKIPAETQSGRVFRLRDKGVKPVRGGARGDLFCRVVIETPVHLSAEQRELIRRLEESLQAHGAKHAPRQPLLTGTTGFAAELEGAFAAAARDIPLLVAANTSLGVTLLLELVRIAARTLPTSFDIDVLDMHHRSKPDVPSGTALALGAAAREARQGSAPVAGASGAAPATDTPHREGGVGFASVRAGDLVGEHTVLFAGLGEALSLTHRATDRRVFARGALAAALWLQSRPPGRYTMRDLLAQKTIT